jgi:hypothetical protein
LIVPKSKEKMVARVTLERSQVFERLREWSDTSWRERLFGGREFIAQMKESAFWIQSRPGGPYHPQLVCKLLDDGFTTVMILRPRGPHALRLWVAALTLDLLLLLPYSWLLGWDVPLHALFLALPFILPIIVAGTVVAALIDRRRPRREISLVKEIFADELLEWRLTGC